MGEPKSTFMARIGQPVGGPGRADKYDPAHCETIKLLAQDGKFPETWACQIGVSVETLRLWGHKHPEFKEALIIAKHLLGHYWTEQVAKGTKNPAANSAMFSLILRRLPALFGRDPVDLTEYVLRPDTPDEGAAQGSLTTEQVKAASTDELQAHLEALRRRRMEDHQ